MPHERSFRNKEQLVAEALSAAGDKTIAVVGRNIGKRRRQCCGRQLSVDVAPRFTEPDLPVRSPGQRNGSRRRRDQGRRDRGSGEAIRHARRRRIRSRGTRTGDRRPLHDDWRHDFGSNRSGQPFVRGNPQSRERSLTPITRSSRWCLHERLTLFSPTRVHRGGALLSV